MTAAIIFAFLMAFRVLTYDFRGWFVECAVDLFRINDLIAWQPNASQFEDCRRLDITFSNGSNELLQTLSIMQKYDDQVMSALFDAVEPNEVENIILAMRGYTEVLGLLIATGVFDSNPRPSNYVIPDGKRKGRVSLLCSFEELC